MAGQHLGDEGDRVIGAGRAEPQRHARVADFLPAAHVLADYAKYSELLSRHEWRFIDAMAWIASRDFGVLKGFRESADGSGVSDAGWSRLLCSYGLPRISGKKIFLAFHELQTALADGKLKASGRRDLGDREFIPPEAWSKGIYLKDNSGTWWEGPPQISVGWTQITVEQNAVLEYFEAIETCLEQRAPTPHYTWIPLTAALMWIHCSYAADIGELMSESLRMLGKSSEHVRSILELKWRKLANVAAQGLLTVRGRTFDGIEVDRDERDLTRDELLNCKWFDWVIGDHNDAIVGAVYRVKPDDVDLSREGMRNFAFVNVEREGLMQCWPAPADKPSMGTSLSQQLVLVDNARLGDLMPIAEAHEIVAATVPAVDGLNASRELLAPADLILEAGIEQLRDLLKGRKIAAFVCEPDGKHWRIPVSYWDTSHSHSPLAGSGFSTERSHGELAYRLNGMGVHIVRIDLEAALKFAHAKEVTTAKTITDLRAWLCARLDSCSPDTITRKQIELEAKTQFKISGKAFSSTWQSVTADDRSRWNKGGRKPRTPKGLAT